MLSRWRFPIACQMLFSLLVLACCPFLVETPRWLAKHGHTEKARHVIAQLLDKPDDDPEVKGQLNEILEGIAIEDEMGEPTWTEVFSNGTKTRNLQRVLLGMGPFMMNQYAPSLALILGTSTDMLIDGPASTSSATISRTFSNITSISPPRWRSSLLR